MRGTRGMKKTIDSKEMIGEVIEMIEEKESIEIDMKGVIAIEAIRIGLGIAMRVETDTRNTMIIINQRTTVESPPHQEHPQTLKHIPKI